MIREEFDVSTDAPIFSLLDEILAHIMTFLTLKERLLAERTCQWFRNVSMHYWASVKEIAISGYVEGFDDHTLDLLLSRGSWSLLSLDLSSPYLTDGSLHAIAQNCENLRSLSLWDGNFTDDGLKAVAKRLSHLQAFKIRASDQIHDEGLWWMFHGNKKLRSVYCLEALGPDITELRLKRCSELEDDAIQKTLHSCGKVEILSLETCSKLTDVSLSAIGQCSKITELVIGDFPLVTKFGLKSLCCLKHLESLTLSNLPSIDDDVFVAISKGCHKLRKLNFYASNSKVTDIGICSIAVHCPLLFFLNASHLENISDLSLKSMAAHSAHIEEVFLDWCPGVTDEGVVDLIARCPKLSFLSVEKCRNISDDTVAAAISRAERNPSLTIILTGTSVDRSKLPKDTANLTLYYYSQI